MNFASFVLNSWTRDAAGHIISHGTRDEVLPIARTSRLIVPSLEAAGYPVKYVEFEGPHTVPDEIGQEAFDWFAG